MCIGQLGHARVFSSPLAGMRGFLYGSCNWYKWFSVSLKVLQVLLASNFFFFNHTCWYCTFVADFNTDSFTFKADSKKKVKFQVTRCISGYCFAHAKILFPPHPEKPADRDIIARTLSSNFCTNDRPVSLKGRGSRVT